MNRISFSSRILPGIILICCFGYSISNAQSPSISNIYTSWPTVNFAFRIHPATLSSYYPDKAHFRLFEDEREIHDFKMIHDSTDYSPRLTAALVFSAGASMAVNSRLELQKAGGLRYVEMMRPSHDNASLITYADTALMRQEMTHDTSLLRNAIENISAGGGRAIFDGVMKGMQHIDATDSTNGWMRFVIVVTDGIDSTSTHTLSQCIAFSNQERIKVYVISLGASVNAQQLDSLAGYTGGRYWGCADFTSLDFAFRAIVDENRVTLPVEPHPPRIEYNTICADGAFRNIRLVCGGPWYSPPDTANGVFLARRDTSGYSPLSISAGEGRGLPGDTVSVPILLSTPISDEPFSTASFILEYPSQDLRFLDFMTGESTLLKGVQVQAAQITGGIRGTIAGRMILDTSGGILLWARFRVVGMSVGKTCPITLKDWKFDTWCFRAVLSGGSVRIAPYLRIASEKGGLLCPGDSTVLTATDGFFSYLWSTGDTTRSITAASDGVFRCRARAFTGDTLTDSIRIEYRHVETPRIIADRGLSLCPGDSVKLEVASFAASYAWSTGDNSRHITVRAPGLYSVSVVDWNSCHAKSDTVEVVSGWTDPSNITGSRNICPGARAQYSVPDTPGALYEWSVAGGDMIGSADSSAVTILWRNAGTGRVGVKVSHQFIGCIGVASTDVEIQKPKPPDLTISGRPFPCEGDTVRIAVADSLWTTFLWNTGDTIREIAVTRSGRYYAHVSNAGGCAADSDTADLFFAAGPAPRITGPDSVCAGMLVQYSTPEFQGHIYEWSISGGVPVSSSFSSSITVRWQNHATGRLSVRESDGNCEGTAHTSVIISTIEKPLLAVGGNTAFCEGDSVTLEAGDGYAGYLWNTGAVSRTIAAKSTGVYYVTVTDASGCSAESDTVYVVVHSAPAPRLVITGAASFCSGDSVILDAGDGYASYLWSDASAGRFLIAKTTGSCHCEVTDTNGCSGVSDTVSVTVYQGPPKPVIVRTGDTLGTDEASRWQWYLDGAAIAGANSRSMAIPRIGKFKVEVTDSNGCRAVSDEFDVAVLGIEQEITGTRPSLELYPEPHGGSFTVIARSLESGIDAIRVYDVFGREVYNDRNATRPGSAIRRVSLQGCASGVYMVAIHLHSGGMMTCTTRIR